MSSNNRLDGLTQNLAFRQCLPVLFTTRKAARVYIEDKYGYYRKRPDLLKEPHGWRMPKPVRVTVSVWP